MVEHKMIYINIIQMKKNNSTWRDVDMFELYN